MVVGGDMVMKKPKIVYKPSEVLKKRRKERRGRVKEKVEKAEKEYEGGGREGREGKERRYIADRCFDDIPVKGRRLYTGKITDTKSDDLFSLLKYKEV